MKVLVLYTRFSAYVNASFSHFAQRYDTDVHVVRYQTDTNSPFKLAKSSKLFFYSRDGLKLKDIQDIIVRNDIKVVISAGWGDKLYMRVAKWAYDRNLLTICIVDNQWMGTWKQRILSMLSPFILKNRFRKLWIPGVYQFEYARRLGFARYDIMFRYYTADTNLFVSPKVVDIPNRFIYVGRLLEIKGVEVLYESLVSLITDLKKNDWKFVVIGSGEMQEEFSRLAEQNDCFEYYPFLQPNELATMTAQGGVFVLPSNYDAWGVVVHEYAIIGCPLLLSEAVGSRSAFLIEGYNGKVFVSGSSRSLQEQCNAFMRLSSAELNNMGEGSRLLGNSYNLDIWASTLKGTIDEYLAGVKYKRLRRTRYQ